MFTSGNKISISLYNHHSLDKKTFEYAKYTIQIPGVTTPAPADTTLSVTAAPAITLSPPSCSIFSLNGTVLDPFTITCTTPTSCSDGCQYCFKTDQGKHLRCSSVNKVTLIFLPLGEINSNYKLSVVVTVTEFNTKTRGSTTFTTQVWPAKSCTPVQELQSAVADTVANLGQQGMLSGETLGQMFKSVSDMLNKDSSEENNNRMKLREQMLMNITEALENNSSSTPQNVQLTARAVAGLTMRGDELSPNAQLEASFLVANLSSSLLSMNVSEHGGEEEMVKAATPIVEAVSNILDVSSNREVSDLLLKGMDNVQSALLNGKKVDEAPVIVNSSQITVFVNR
ncbi:polycystic kidney disease protein 1-like 2 [Coregonus clupeaformis]|uniref:polycystic kidney disease protein 1-like 2 n=1 Tax=Coregonus clupeaformis TaxID=59861 RepID=UPI001E1C38A1|nr:polycystic kidney disease protein 1-like 2 [Coregonus clupeaformis]